MLNRSQRSGGEKSLRFSVVLVSLSQPYSDVLLGWLGLPVIGWNWRDIPAAIEPEST